MLTSIPPAGLTSATARSSTRNLLLKLFLLALGLRWAYAFALYAEMGDQGLMQGDSLGYLSTAQSFAKSITEGPLHGWDWVSPHLNYMPLFMWTLSLCVLAAGPLAPLVFVLLQGLADAETCLLIYGLAASIDRRIALPTAFAACLNPTQIIISGFVYSDTLFLFCATLSLLAALRWRATRSWSDALMMGAALGAASLCRILIVPWAPAIAVLLLLMAVFSRSLQVRHIWQMVAALAIFCICLSPIFLRNKMQYDAWALTPQSGSHMAFWVVPLVREAQDGTPWVRGVEQMRKRIDDTYPAETSNPFEVSRHQSAVAQQALKELGPVSIFKAWLIGAAINLGAPALILSPPVAQLPRTGFFGTPGNSPFEKIRNFLLHSDNATYGWALLLGILGVAVIRCIQLVGVVALLRAPNRAGLSVLGLWVVFILAVNGPVASAKYRLPIEPPLMILTGAGFCGVYRLFKRPA